VIQPRVHLVPPSGILLPTRHFGEVVGSFPPASTRIQQALSWNWLVGPHEHLRVDRDGVRSALREHFDWARFIEHAATILAQLRGAKDAGAYADLTLQALSDDWPAAVDRPELLIQAFVTAQRSPASVSEQGLLALIADALASPWDSPSQLLPESKRLRRLLRLAMLASEVMDDRSDPERRNEPRQESEEETFSAEILLGIGRLREPDALSTLVRSHELYVELLPSIFPDADDAFERARGASVTNWIADVYTLAQAFSRQLQPGARWTASVNLASVVTDRSLARLQLVARRLSRDRESFRDRFGSIKPEDVNRGLAFQPLRETPLLWLPAVGEHYYVILHVDFVLASGDDGIYFGMQDALPPAKRAAFRTAFGKAFERYVERVLLRCSTAATDSSFARIEEGGGSEEPKRCDFAWRLGDQLILIDAKRVGFSSLMLMGGDGLRKRYADDLVNGFEQLLATAEDVARLGVETVIPALDVPAGWRPARTFGVIVHHRPIFLWFGSAARLLKDAGLADRWQNTFAASPRAFSIAEVELLEAALPSFDFQSLLDALATDDVRTYLGLDTFLEATGWRGFSVSPYFKDRAEKLLAAQ
jgi:hypothetical protein